MSQKTETVLLYIAFVAIMMAYCMLLFDVAFPTDPEQERIADENKIRAEKRVEYYEGK
ncbi:hypothetical protein [Alkalihalobacillus sp. R86527]|uniref:hypothetical protein n=1 Tax=Alkalihalobacillus sp. R86527 TaxID=3093863 RepID=UPI00366B7DBB